jgi:hypothetical protein
VELTVSNCSMDLVSKKSPSNAGALVLGPLDGGYPMVAKYPSKVTEYRRDCDDFVKPLL